MNYYPNNFYQNYLYNNPYNQNSIPTSQPQMSSLQGKVVDGTDMVKATEVLYGGYGVFPKADLSEIYIKNWNNDGTTQIITYRPVLVKEPAPEMDVQNILLEKIKNIEEKLDILTVNDKNTTLVSSSTTPKSSDEKRKGVDLNAY